MTLMLMIFVTDIDLSLAFYTALGDFTVLEQSDAWAEVGVGTGAVVALHAAEQLPEETARLGLNLNTEEPLEGLVPRLAGQGITSKMGITEEVSGAPWCFVIPTA